MEYKVCNGPFFLSSFLITISTIIDLFLIAFSYDRIAMAKSLQKNSNPRLIGNILERNLVEISKMKSEVIKRLKMTFEQPYTKFASMDMQL